MQERTEIQKIKILSKNMNSNCPFSEIYFRNGMHFSLENLNI